MPTINMTIGSGVTNSSPIVDGVVKVLAGGKNNAPVVGTVILSGGTNTSKGTVTGGLVIASGGTNSAPVTGNVLVTSGTNTGSVTGTVRVGAGGTQGGTITGTLILDAGATVKPGTVVASGGTVIVAAGANVATVMTNITNFTGTVTQSVTVGSTTSLQAIPYTGGSAGTPTTITGVYYNLEPSPNNNKAYTYTQFGKALTSGVYFNLTGDNKAYSWSNGVIGTAYTGPLNGVNYVNGVAEYVPPPADAFVEFTVQADTNTATPGKLYTATGGSVTVGPVYTTSGRTALYTGAYLYSGTTYYATVGTPQTYRSWTVTGDRTAVFTSPAVTSLTSGLVYTTSALSNAYTGTFTYNNEGYYSDAGTARKYRAWTVTVTGGTTTLYTAPAATSVLSSTTYNNTTLSSAYSGILIDNAVTYYVAAGTARTYRAWTVTNGASVLYTAPAGDVTVGPVKTDTALATGYTGNFTYNGTAYTAAAGIVGSAGRAWTVTGGTTGGTLYTSAVGTIPTATVYTTAALNTAYTGVFTYGDNTYYAVAGVANLYRAWTVSNDDTNIVTDHTLYTVADGNVLTSSVYTDSARQIPYTGTYTSGATSKYALDGTPQSYIGYAVTNDTNTANPHNLYSDPLFTGLPGTFLYTESSLTNKYTGYYEFGGSSYYALAGELVDYRPWTVTLAGSSATVYTDVIAALVTGSPIYTTSAKDTPYTTVAFYLGTYGTEGYTRVDTDVSGIATAVVQNHQYTSYGSYYHDNATLANGETVYTGQYTDATANDVSITLESDGVAGFGTFSTNGQGVATITLVNHSNNYDASTWWDNTTLATGDTVYTGQYTLSTANTTTFYSGTENISTYSYVTTDSSGIATVTAVNHAYGSGGTRWDSTPLTTGAVVYAGQYTNSVAGNASFTIGIDGNSGFGSVSTDGGGIATVNMADHQYNDYGNNGQYYSWDSNPLVPGATVYNFQYSFSLAQNVSFTYGIAGIAGYTIVTTDSSGIATVTPVNHPYGSGGTWWDNATLANGDTVYAGQYTNSVAGSVTFIEGTNSVTTDSSGIATLTPVINHPYVIASYYHDNATLATGDTLYTGQYASNTANDVSFTFGIDGRPGFSTVTTDSSGIATVTAVNHAYGANTGAWWNNATLANGDTVYSGQYTMAKSYGMLFTIGTDGYFGYTIVTTDSSGIATVTAVNHAYGSGGTRWDSNPLTTGAVVYSGQYTNSVADNASFTIGEETSAGFSTVTTASSGIATVTAVNHAYAYSRTDYFNATVYADVMSLSDGVVMYNYRYGLTTAANIPTTVIGTEGTEGYGTYTTDGNGVVDVTLVNHPYEFIPGGISSNSPLPVSTGSGLTQLVYVNKYSMQPATATSFRVDGRVYTIDSTGNLGLVENFTGYAAGTVYNNGSVVGTTFSAPAEYRPSCDTPANHFKLTLSGPGNIGDLVYKTESRANSTAPFTADFGPFNGVFSDGVTWWTASSGVIVAPGANNCTDYSD